jgi:hypothetical protein
MNYGFFKNDFSDKKWGRVGGGRVKPAALKPKAVAPGSGRRIGKSKMEIRNWGSRKLQEG